MERSEHINELAAALAKFQGQLEQPKMNSTVKVKTRTGGEYSFKYADLSECKAAARKALAENELSVTQLVEDDYSVNTMLMHSSGQWISSRLRMPVNTNVADAQTIGAAITYAKRYAFCAILGIVADDDNDANEACGNLFTKQQARPQQRRQPQQPQKPVFTDKQLNNKDFFPRIDAARKKSEAEGKSFSLKAFLEQYFQPLDDAAIEIINSEYANYRINQSN